MERFTVIQPLRDELFGFYVPKNAFCVVFGLSKLGKPVSDCC
jgi:hypothetical protein